MHESAAPPVPPVPPAESQQQDAPHGVLGYLGGQQQENPLMDSANDLEHSSTVESRTCQESSSDEDDVPLRDRRLRDRHQRPSSTTPVQEHQDFQKPANTSPISIDQIHKRPGPKPWAAKPIAKNDLKAKIEVIRAIEKNWGKSFITDYIPKCHRPLQKKKGGKRTSFRQHEQDPKKWLPSVLKALLGISYLTTDKAFLKKAMNNIVRHRIKHTGNRKPQLVTTDFDVIEDMITRGWDIETSFSIRYKHLLLANPKGNLETDEDIDHILACGDDDYQRISDRNVESENDEDDDMEVDGPEEDARTDFYNPYAPTGAYIHGSPHQPPRMIVPKQPKLSKSVKKEKQMKPAKATKQSKLSNGSSDAQSPHEQLPPHMYGGYGIPGYGPYGAFPGYPPMPGYPPPNVKGFPQPPPYGKGYLPMPPMYPWPGYGQHPGHGYGQQQPDKDGSTEDPHAQAHGYPPYGFPSHGYPGMPPYPPLMSPSPSLQPSTPAPSAPPHPSGPARFSPFGSSKRSASRRPDPATSRYDASSYSRAPRIKHEPGFEDHPIAIEGYANGSGNDLREVVDEDSQDGDQQALDEIAKQERHIQMLRARLAKKKSRG